MAFQDYSRTASANTIIGDDIYIGPNMARNEVRPAFQQLAADGRETWDYVATLMSTVEGGVSTGDLTLRADLATNGGAAMVGTANGETVQRRFDLLFGGDRGAIPDGVGSDLMVDRRFSGVGSSSGLYGENNQITAYGSAAIGSVRNSYWGAVTETTAGVTDLLESGHFFGWVRGQGNVTTVKVVEAHLVAGRDGNGVDVPSAGTITGSGTYFNCAGITLGTTVTIPKVIGFNAGQIASGAQVTEAYGFNCEHNQSTAVGGVVAGYRSQVRNVTGSWSFLANTNDGTEAAPAGLGGSIKIGRNGDNSISAPSWRLHVLGAADDYAACIQNRTGTSPYGLRLESTAAAPRNTTVAFLSALDTTGFVAQMFSNGNWVNLNNSYGAISDRNLKTGIRDASSQLADIRALRVRKFRMKADGKDAVEQIGLIAQEVEKVSPGLVFKTKQDRKTIRGVHYSVVNLKLLKAVQELADMVEKQGAEIVALKKQLSA